MKTEELAAFAMQRVTAHEGLAIDAATWTDAHMYHQTAQRLHTRALHGWGIVSGLRVVAADPPARTVILQPGLAIDRYGNVIRVAQPVRVALTQTGSGTVCVVLRFVDMPVDGSTNSPPSRVNEFFNALAVTDLPLQQSDIEVARVELGSGSVPIQTAGTPWAPEVHEIDERFRHQMRPATADTLTVGQLILGDQTGRPLHQQGVANVLRHLRASAPCVVQFAGEMHIDAAVGQCNLLYLAGAGAMRLTPKEGAQLLAFLRGGGTLFAEPCFDEETRRQENGRFVASFQRLMADLKYELTAIGADHPVFNARYTFGAPAAGTGGQAALFGKGNAILNPNDYGCCWQGGTQAKPLPREVIRSAVEFAENVAWHASEQALRQP